MKMKTIKITVCDNGDDTINYRNSNGVLTMQVTTMMMMMMKTDGDVKWHACGFCVTSAHSCLQIVVYLM